MFDQKKYDKSCKSKEKLHEYALLSKHNGILTLYKSEVNVKYFYVDGIPMVHEVYKNGKYDNSIFNSGRTKESYEYSKFNHNQLSWLNRAGFISQWSFETFSRFTSIRDRIETLKFKQMKKLLGSFQQTIILNGKLYKRKDVIEKCKQMG